MAELRCEDLRHVYSAGTPFEKTALDRINLSLPQGQLIGMIGHTGSGKSTLIQHLNALLRPTSGTVTYDGADINESKISRRDIKQKVGLVFQYPEYQLFEETVYKDIAFGPRNMGLGEDEIRERVLEAARFTGIEEELFERSPLELSGGQKRRIAIAGVIAMRPRILILDEPTAGLDPSGSRQILDNICRYRRETGSTVIFVSHNMDDVARIADRIIVISHGSVFMDGRPEEIFAEPEKLLSQGLDVPRATAIAMELRSRGLPIRMPVCTHEQLLAAVTACRRGSPC